jgi:tetratricopeptide (TPR) repeat protein
MKRASCLLSVIALFAATAPAAFAQPFFTTPRASQAASVTQRVGLTDITVSYHRPGVKNRTVWGALVPYGEVWRAGANENTTIAFSHSVTIDDRTLPAGTYGLHVIPTETEWTFILSSQSRAWGSFSYDEAEDVLRVTVTPEPIDHQEWLLYAFEDPTANEVMLSLSWEMLKGSFPIWTDTDVVTVEALRTGLRGLARFNWQGWQQAASWCLNNNTNLEEAMTWIDRSIQINKNFTNTSVKAGLLTARGDAAAAGKLLDEAMKTATENELNAHGYQLLARNKVDEAIAVFKKNASDHPDSWNAHDSLAEAYMTAGDTANAVKFYKKALSMVKDDQQKARIEGQLKQLEG